MARRSGIRGSTIFGVVLGAALLVSLVNSLTGRGDERPRGSGGVVSETREVGSFSGIELSGLGNVTVSPGAEPSLVVRAPENLLGSLRTRVEGDTLVIGTTRRVGFSGGRVTYRVVTPSLERISLSGAGDIRAEAMAGDDVELYLSGSGDLYVGDLHAEELEVDLSGEGDVQLSGEATEQTVSLSGVGDYRACALLSETTEVEVSGVGDALVWATRTLDAEVSGVGSVRYRGEPEVDMDVSGVGSVSRLQGCD